MPFIWQTNKDKMFSPPHQQGPMGPRGPPGPPGSSVSSPFGSVLIPLLLIQSFSSYIRFYPAPKTKTCCVNLLFLLSIRVLRVSLAPLESPVSPELLWVYSFILLNLHDSILFFILYWMVPLTCYFLYPLFHFLLSHDPLTHICMPHLSFVINTYSLIIMIQLVLIQSFIVFFLGSHGFSWSLWPPWKERRWCKRFTDYHSCLFRRQFAALIGSANTKQTWVNGFYFLLLY